MTQIRSFWTALDRRRQIALVAATVAVFAAVLVMSRIATAPTMSLLFAGLENGTAGNIVQSLEQRGIAYEVRGGSIYVPVSQRDELRMTLASAGLPANGGRGYELLDSLTGFGTTSQMFDAAYWRAKEGELARTIVASPHIVRARVHLAQSGSNPFRRGAEPTASVSVVPAGAAVTPAQASALRHLVASAVAGLTVENVAVIDANGALIGSSETSADGVSGDDRARQLRERVLRLIEARVGAGNAVVEVSVDTVTQTELIREHRFDPESRVAISTDTEERSDTSQNGAGGEVTVASNLPGGEAANDASRAQASETRERVNYEVSETQREITRGPGAVRRITVAVLVNGLPQGDADGGFQPRPQDELDALHDLVASAVGYDAERGDIITLRSLELPVPAIPGTAAQATLVQRLGLDLTSMIKMAVLAVVSLILGLFVIRPLLARPPAAEPIAALPPADPAAAAPALTGEIQPDAGTGDGQAGSGALLPAAEQPRQVENPVDRLRHLIGERQEETVEILRGWLEDSEEKA
ncbi:flagellar basal-body MS-ring/collar protein FliF [Pukyongiella litopenaei]|uniref:Flagellar M-ring protein n=1 Tax=Pukyongiella litopenaei TaxID=2605946 RepID=A0A2S0MSK4_9RHOB|nr:flagellar basal-body MS-ring/collar protein FliF [Pukyongiella litopenaei]AVO38846.1 flagellar M-ring protein FliF [Pukyongiella litopenaei]